MENGDALYQKFMSSKQAPVRLELALSGFFQPDGYTDKQHRDFGDYLRLRIRPAAEVLIQRDALDKLQVLEELGWNGKPGSMGFMTEVLTFEAEGGFHGTGRKANGIVSADFADLPGGTV